MSKVLTSRDYKRVLSEVTEYAYMYLVHINNDMVIAKKDGKDKTPDEQAHLDALVQTFNLINDIIHPAHLISYNLLKIKPSFIEFCQKMHALETKDKNPESCFCGSCQDFAQNLRDNAKESSRGKESN